jgi:hypothetical protein
VPSRASTRKVWALTGTRQVDVSQGLGAFGEG